MIIKNMFCSETDLKNEADVEALFVDRLLNKLKYPDNRVSRKESISQIVIGRGSQKENYKPDYVLYDSAGEPIIVLDAKSPKEKSKEYHYQVSAYALYLNQKYADKNPVRYVAIVNGNELIVWPWDSDQPIFFLRFEDFQEQNEKWLELNSNIGYDAFRQVALTKDIFHFERPELSTLIKTFNDCHNLIRKKDNLPPADAFYEFSKLMFIKIREDNKIHKILSKGKSPKKEDFVFSTDWINTQSKVDSNPVDSILFRQIRDELEEKIKKGEKKRIFEQGERLNLSVATIFEVVKALQSYDLYGIDEDLNGRMFETFLNATVRGKDLGQFFTPRGIVHYMVETSTMNISVKNKDDISSNIPYILDGCCGSGGFLIDTMAVMTKAVDSMKQLSTTEREDWKEEIRNHHIFGIDANGKIARVSRLNMYLHGDGGSKIFKANTLDKHLSIDPGISREEQDGLKELDKYLQKIKFNVVLTNPPFSINYKASDPSELQLLKQYEIAKHEGTLSASEKSNVLFIERYNDLLKNDGELLTIIDDTVLNGEDSQDYRDYIFNNFIIIQIVSLPFNAFFRAEANIKTSMLHLRKKKAEEEQGDVFMAITNNIGHDDHQRDSPARNNLPTVAKFFNEWKTTGKRFSEILHNEDPDEPLGCPLQVFSVSPNELKKNRLDAFYYSVELKEQKSKIRKLLNDNKIELKTGKDFNIISSLKKDEVMQCQGKIFKYIEIGDVTIDGTIVKYREDYFENLPTRGRLKVKENDIVFAKNNSSRGTTILVPQWYADNLVTTGFIGVRPKDYEEALILWSVFESEFFRKQIYYLAITASQPEVRENIFQNEMIIPWPKTEKQREELIKNVKLVDKARDELKTSLAQAKDIANKLFF